MASLAGADDAFAAIALAAVACDGELSAAEARQLRLLLEWRQPYCQRSAEAMGALLDRLLAILRQAGWEDLAAMATPLLSPQQRLTALAVACQLIWADHVALPTELRALEQLGVLLELDPGQTTAIVEAIGWLNRDSLAS